ncbi:MAG TPA: GNAT family N-acetyltransferase [candidate division Zixibacteria bacterium]|nr:GNAT family N-acetyltransferase [candidate division Zixibacteria bacterium]
MDKLRELLDKYDSLDQAAHKEAAAEILARAESLIAKGADQVDPDLWHYYLDVTGRHVFVDCLSEREARYRWAETTFKAIAASNYGPLQMFEQRVRRHPDHTLFQDMSTQPPAMLSYKLIADRLRSIASALYHITPEPRVAIFSENCVDGACTDLACLFYDILVTPINVHTDPESLAWMFDLLKINIVVTDGEIRYQRLLKARAKCNDSFKILTMTPNTGMSEAQSLTEATLAVAPSEGRELLKNRRRRPLDEVATVMFTSGSTGRPKGVSFSLYNLITKRFARSAALPQVGDNEVLLCYLPLFHTFGRFFEMMGAIYWSGTYVFPGNPSSETLMALLKQVNPTGLISVPIRWVQIHERCEQHMSSATSLEGQNDLFREVVGGRLRWGLSAAGYLAPAVFKFFNRYGVSLCSGFGMTEATGGITMTPPGDIPDNSIGIPLPGVKARLSKKGELSIAGPYIARYYDDAPVGGTIPIDPKPEDEPWIATGDLFHRLENGHYEIVDRLKDIYKNSRGQTIAPRKVEKKLEGVAGVKRSFLVGDAREFNVLLIVPDLADPVVVGFQDQVALRDYYHQIVTNANTDLAPFERVINFAVLDRDFDVDKEELTPKGSFRRKVIEKNFETVIGELYQSKYVELYWQGYTIRIPRWFHRDISVLEDDIIVDSEGLTAAGRPVGLRLAKTAENRVVIGDLSYELTGRMIDLGLMARQPLLWIGNPSLIAFGPCREGWDLPPEPFSGQVQIPDRAEISAESLLNLPSRPVRDQELAVVNQLILQAQFGPVESASWAVTNLGRALEESDERVARVIRRRLEGLAYHPEFKIRSLAYRTLLLDEPSPDYGRVLPSFIESGLAFLDEDSIREVAQSNLKHRRLQALRQRMYTYRTQLTWPASEVTRHQFEHMLALLANFARVHPEYYNTARAELAGWILHKDDPRLATFAEVCFAELSHDYEKQLLKKLPSFSEEVWDAKIEFGEELTASEKYVLRQVLVGTGFLEESIILAFDEHEFDLGDVPDKGIWISRIISRRHYLRYRVSVNASSGKHYDLQLIINEDVTDARVLETIYWLMSISSYPYGSPVLPRLGCCRLELNARSLVYQGELTVWEKIRELSSQEHRTDHQSGRWRKLFIEALGTYFKGWLVSGRRIVTGAVTPENVMVPEQDFRQGAAVQSITGWRPYENTLSLIRPMVQNFFRRTEAHYPWYRSILNTDWIFDACVEKLGLEEGQKFLTQLREDLHREVLSHDQDNFCKRLDDYLIKLSSVYYVSLPLQNAIDRYHEWDKINPSASPQAREQITIELLRLYRLDRLPEIARYHLYRHTYFAKAEGNVREAFDTLLRKMFKKTTTPAIQLIELSDLQSTIEDLFDRQVFSQLIFPKAQKTRQMDILTVGDSEHKHVILRTSYADQHGEVYTFREPIEPAEIGQLYRLFFKEGYPKTVTERDRFLVVADAQEQLVGGLCYRFEGDDVVHLDGSVIAPPVMGRGIGSALVEDFCNRMANQGMRVVKTHFFLRRFYMSRGFVVDKRWGALVRFLKPSEEAE